jgi:hypothetical protein
MIKPSLLLNIVVVTPFCAGLVTVVLGLLASTVSPQPRPGDELVERARVGGFSPSFGPEKREWGYREAYFTDVDGNVLRMGESVEE